jgi:hypothetical protein
MTPEIRAFEFATGLFAVLIGLAVADIASSFHRLARSKMPVKWDPLTLIAALYALCLVVVMWFDLWGVRNFAATRTFFFYLSLIAEFFVLYLIAAASLPDEPGDGDLREYYARNRRYFWILVTLFQFQYVVDGLYFARSEIGRFSSGTLVLIYSLMFAPLAVSFVLLCAKSRITHYLGLVLLLAIMALHYGPASIN